LRTIVLEYAGGPLPGDGSLRPEPPTFSFPCLSLCWEVALPGSSIVEEAGPQLVEADPSPVASWSRRLLGPWPRPWSWRSPLTASKAGSDSLRDLDARVAAMAGTKGTLGDLFTRWDAGRSPLVIDRLAL